MSEQEREAFRSGEPEEAEVEGHLVRRGEGEPPEGQGERSESDAEAPEDEGERGAYRSG